MRTGARVRAVRITCLIALTCATLSLAWLWLAAWSDHPKRLFHSTDRSCSWVGFDRGAFVYSYDGGADVGIVESRKYGFLGVFYESRGGPLVWQMLRCGVHGAYAVMWLSLGWAVTGWFWFLRPRFRRRRGRCVGCGYDVRTGTLAVCPECGRPQR